MDQDIQLVRERQLCGARGRRSPQEPSLLGFSSATLWRLVRKGEFPAPIKLSSGVTAWKLADVRSWVEKQRVR